VVDSWENSEVSLLQRVTVGTVSVTWRRPSLHSHMLQSHTVSCRTWPGLVLSLFRALYYNCVHNNCRLTVKYGLKRS
jgi:hypothetical protein